MPTKKVTLIGTECLNRNYSVSKNPQTNHERLELKKYCRNCNKHTLHKESR